MLKYKIKNKVQPFEGVNFILYDGINVYQIRRPASVCGWRNTFGCVRSRNEFNKRERPVCRPDLRGKLALFCTCLLYTSSTSTFLLISLKRSFCATPKRCSSSMIHSPKSWNTTSFCTRPVSYTHLPAQTISSAAMSCRWGLRGIPATGRRGLRGLKF